ncbi:MAG: hypothetical protein OEU26_35850 [Candidatus Tectomicrobia bacterium]|nr:hypothetical protein [Candidatus Tectomicrobia bacterium]
MTRLPRPLLVLLLSFGLAWLAGCATTPVQIDAPPTSEPYAILHFSSAMQLIAVNDQTIDSSQPVRTLRVRPGSHTLRFVHLNDGPEGSASHAGQKADPFTLEAHEGVTYEFEAKT